MNCEKFINLEVLTIYNVSSAKSETIPDNFQVSVCTVPVRKSVPKPARYSEPWVVMVAGGGVVAS